ncbi:hypothetical protein SAMN05519103_06068 [Rhizobiales bacterium GAS113]|nr:hypothetical protein SAMN05519103_06068 [Rhizobiales bacterium GAS113]
MDAAEEEVALDRKRDLAGFTERLIGKVFAAHVADYPDLHDLCASDGPADALATISAALTAIGSASLSVLMGTSNSRKAIDNAW